MGSLLFPSLINNTINIKAQAWPGTTDFLPSAPPIEHFNRERDIIFQIYLDLDVQHCFPVILTRITLHYLSSSARVFCFHTVNLTALNRLGLNFLGWLLGQGPCPLWNDYIVIDDYKLVYDVPLSLALFIVFKTTKPSCCDCQTRALLVSVCDSVPVMTDRNISSPAVSVSHLLGPVITILKITSDVKYLTRGDIDDHLHLHMICWLLTN